MCVCVYIYIYIHTILYYTIPGECAGSRMCGMGHGSFYSSTNALMGMLLIRIVLSYIFFIMLTFL